MTTRPCAAAQGSPAAPQPRTVGLRDRLQLRMSQARDRLLSLQATAVDSARSAGHAADDYVHDHPWRSAVIGMGIGMLLGLLVGQRR